MPDTTAPRFPARLWIVRHGESAGNIARDAARLTGQSLIDIAERDADVPLSPLGCRQSTSLGRWFAASPGNERPDVLLVSPYLRARQTADLIAAAGARSGEDGNAPVVDERLREKEFGVFDRLTQLGIRQQYPDQWALRLRLGKVLLSPPRRRELVRCHPSPAKCA